jgi:hypothetical protein
MTTRTRTSLLTGISLVMTLALSNGCLATSDTGQAAASQSGEAGNISARSLMSGSTINVTLGSAISSETASVGDAWHGTLAGDVETKHGAVIRAGSPVNGVVTGAVGAKRGSRAMLDLAVRSIGVHGRDESITASGESVIAGSPRARNLGAIAGGVAAGAIIGNVVGDGRNATVGGLIGGAAATGVVAGSKGYQVVLKSGTRMSFTVNQTVALR